ncbi:50S ribosomal protein L18 [Pontibacillus yanchengensis]|uniref:Large ribosomal subunit protein uL18 n=3 Tax=Pontibacillus yanchengensis TaxID=462910 RepID=A0A0A2TT83_9BACI|nr:50S ribosomal protein L18 [Pontibacillus yanchengensis]KGP72475.1 50S ribosomal protein L18 [Pontibacillus yanchengensis Y32]MYL35875.1 50S ribosomal protein L18 [Pontibacillus yanchengensis]MYL55595.1 50S ribosomal protein L18 [Pontibacillus yanchengensis]
MITKADKNAVRKKRHSRVRKKVAGTPERPRLNVYRSNKHIYAQLIDDVNGVTVSSASTVENDLNLENTGNVEAAAKIGELVAKRAQDNGFKTIVFDRGGYLYHGRVKALADAAREAGLEF